MQEKKTPADPFGRIETAYSITAANAGAYTALHSLVIPKEIHDPLMVDGKIFIDLMETCMTWFGKAHQYNPNALFPTIIWNAFHRAGASLFHPHIQVMLTEKPFQENLDFYEKLNRYEKLYHNDFTQQFLYISNKLTLTVKTSKNAYIIANLTPIKQKETLIISEETSLLPASLIFSTYDVLEVMIKKLGVKNFNMGINLPPINGSWKNFPQIVHIVDRGEDGKPSDIASMELFFASVISSDPFQLADSLRKFLK